MKHSDAEMILIESGCVKTGQGFLVDVPIDQFIECVAAAYTAWLKYSAEQYDRESRN